MSIVSTFEGRSAVVARPEVVSTPGFDVDVVVTEHGIADLRGSAPAEGAERMVTVADPAHRTEFADHAPAWSRPPR